MSFDGAIDSAVTTDVGFEVVFARFGKRFPGEELAAVEIDGAEGGGDVVVIEATGAAVDEEVKEEFIIVGDAGDIVVFAAENGYSLGTGWTHVGETECFLDSETGVFLRGYGCFWLITKRDRAKLILLTG